MHNTLPDTLTGLADALQDGKPSVIGWLDANFSKLTQEDLLRGSGVECPCGTCHAPQYRLFKKIFTDVLNHDELQELLLRLFTENPTNVTLPETAYILICWMDNKDTQFILKPFPGVNPVTRVKYIDTLPEPDRKRTKRHTVYASAVELMDEIVNTLATIGISEEQLEVYQHYCQERWLSGYKPQQQSGKPQIKEDTFEKRFTAAMQGSPEHFDHYFNYHSDKDLLISILLQPENRHRIHSIVLSLPKSNKSSWKKWGERLLQQSQQILK